MNRTVAQFPIEEDVADALKFAGQSCRDDLGYWYYTFRIRLEDGQMDGTTIVGQLVDAGWQLQGGPVLVEASDHRHRHIIVSMLHAEPRSLQIHCELRITGELHGGGELRGQSVSRLPLR
jgi:hypothetical protein